MLRQLDEHVHERAALGAAEGERGVLGVESAAWRRRRLQVAEVVGEPQPGSGDPRDDVATSPRARNSASRSGSTRRPATT